MLPWSFSFHFLPASPLSWRDDVPPPGAQQSRPVTGRIFSGTCLSARAPPQSFGGHVGAGALLLTMRRHEQASAKGSYARPALCACWEEMAVRWLMGTEALGRGGSLGGERAGHGPRGHGIADGTRSWAWRCCYSSSVVATSNGQRFVAASRVTRRGGQSRRGDGGHVRSAMAWLSPSPSPSPEAGSKRASKQRDKNRVSRSHTEARNSNAVSSPRLAPPRPCGMAWTSAYIAGLSQEPNRRQR
jgi:hypothetical protein